MSDSLCQLKTLLWAQWDPIGVNTTCCPRDEYDSYASQLLRMLNDGAEHQQIASYLAWAERENMGLKPTDIHDSIAARAIQIHTQAF